MNIKEMIFNMYKDEPIVSKKFRAIISKKYNLSDIEISDIYARIHNYQIKKYGERLDQNKIEFLTAEECKRRSLIRRRVKYYRLNKRGDK